MIVARCPATVTPLIATRGRSTGARPWRRMSESVVRTDAIRNSGPTLMPVTIDVTSTLTVEPRVTTRVDAEVERRTPGSFNKVDGCSRVGTRQHGPNPLVQVGYVDIFVTHDHVLAAISAHVTLTGDVTRLLGMPGITLLDGNANQHARGAYFMRPHGVNVRHARALGANGDRR